MALGGQNVEILFKRLFLSALKADCGPVADLVLWGFKGLVLVIFSKRAIFLTWESVWIEKKGGCEPSFLSQFGHSIKNLHLGQ
jgi:hypothetical protein